VGFLTALGAADVEAILIHELAHIKRRDYLVNLLQSLLEIVFFFNPAVFWVSMLIRTERENCCDDLAVAYHNNKAGYIRALVSCEEYKTAAAGYAMAFAGEKNTLLSRVKRLVGNSNHSLTQVEKTVLAICLVCVGLFAMAFSAKEVSKVSVAARPQSMAVANTNVTKRVPLRKPRKHETVPNSRPARVAAAAKAGPQLADTAGPKLADTATGYGNGDYGYASGDYRYSSMGYAQHRGKYANQNEKYAADQKAIIADLLKDGLISDTNHLHFTINQKEFILNGVPQNTEILKRYKNKYIPADGGDGWEWNHSTEKN
jgi:bla regulator protein blaR1